MVTAYVTKTKVKGGFLFLSVKQKPEGELHVETP